MYDFRTHSRLTGLYAVAGDRQLQVDRESIRYLNCILASILPEFCLPTTPNCYAVDRYINENLSPSLINLVVTKLYQTFLLETSIDTTIDSPSHYIWINFIHYINSTKLVPKLWNQLPVYKRTNEKLELFENAALLSPVKLFTNFDPNYDDLDLLASIERWTYRSLRNFIYGQIRDRGEPLFGLKDLGVVAKLTLSYIRSVRSRYVSKDRLILDTFLIQIFKNYLKRSRILTNQLKPHNWEEIHQEVEIQWHNLELNSPPPSIEKIKQALDAIGDCVRRDNEIRPLDSLDRGLNSDSKQTLGETISSVGNVEDRESVLEGYKQLRPIIQAAIAKLDSIDSAIFKMHYEDGLKQQEIAEQVVTDQPTISKALRRTYRCIVKAIHQQIDNPNNSASKIDSTSIAAMKQVLKILYQN
jgi:RNA polymerase sigma factor (sigma-70 family)